MFVKVVTRPGPEVYGGLCPDALVLPDAFGVGAGSGRLRLVSAPVGAQVSCWGAGVFVGPHRTTLPPVGTRRGTAGFDRHTGGGVRLDPYSPTRQSPNGATGDSITCS